MLMPKRVKYRKQQRGRMRGKALRGAEVTFGEFGLQALEPGWVSARQIEAARRALVRVMRRRGKMWIRIFPDKPYTHKPPETRMGKGKGNVEYWVAVIRPGRVMFEVGGLSSQISVEALRQAAYKLSIKTKVVARHEAVTVTGEQE
jgi:large subunit ribosomal protein L16